MRILIVEEEKKVASFIKKGLQQEGYAADTVHDGADAIHNAALFDYDLVILDLMLPTKAGLDVMREIRSKKPKLPVLVLTAKGAVNDKVAGLDAGADDYLIKPFAFAELSARIRALLVCQLHGLHWRCCHLCQCGPHRRYFVGHAAGPLRRSKARRCRPPPC